MIPTSDVLSAALGQIVQRADDTALLADVESIYAAVEEAIGPHQPVCRHSGRCCRFGEFGHCLFVTSPELVHFIAHYRRELPPAGSPAGRGLLTVLTRDQGEACPLQVDKLCTVHPIRPLGCRLFFCQPGSDKWGRPMFERFHAQMKAICLTRSLPYAYAEWTTTLAQLIRQKIINPLSTNV